MFIEQHLWLIISFLGKSLINGFVTVRVRVMLSLLEHLYVVIEKNDHVAVVCVGVRQNSKVWLRQWRYK